MPTDPSEFTANESEMAGREVDDADIDDSDVADSDVDDSEVGDREVVDSDGDDSEVGDGGIDDSEVVESDADAGATYRGLIGAFPYALRSSESLLFRTYVVIGGLLALGISLLFGLALVVLLGRTAGAAGGTFTFSRAFFIFVGLLVVAPLVAPVLFVAHATRRRGTSHPRYEATLGGLGYLFVGSLYLALVISTPAAQQNTVTGVFAPVIQFFYSLPRLAGLLAPFVVALLIGIYGRR